MKSEAFTPDPMFPQFPVHFYSLAPMRNKCVYALSVPCLVLLT